MELGPELGRNRCLIQLTPRPSAYGYERPLGDPDAIVHDARNRPGQPVPALRSRTYANGDEFRDYLESQLAALATEQMRIFFSTKYGDIQLDEQIYFGTTTEVEVPPQDVILHALALESSAIVLSHNHPSGNHSPSRQDIEYTRKMYALCKNLDIRVHDHIIVSHNGSLSFRELGYM